jgi:hypothetical protein
MAEPRTPPADIRIGRVTVRGRSLTATQGRSLAIWAAHALASRHAATGASLDRVTLRLSAAAIRPDGSIDPAAVADEPGGGRG